MTMSDLVTARILPSSYIPNGQYLRIYVGIENINDPDIDGDGIMNNDDDDIDADGILNEDDEFPYGMSECPSYTDCNDEEFGNAQLDCNGVCGGESITGDLNFDGFTDVYDGQQYINEIIAEDIVASNCTDLDMDGEITVSDIGLLVNCALFILYV